MQSSLGYVLRTRPYSDTSVIVDVFTQDAGRFACMSRPAKLRGKVQRGHLQAFRLLQMDWQGRGEMSRLTQTDERFRHRVPGGHLLYGLYLNELILKLIQPHSNLDQLFTHYQHTVHGLTQAEAPMSAVMQFELSLLEALGHPVNLWHDDVHGHEIVAEHSYHYSLGSGLLPSVESSQAVSGVPIQGELLVALRTDEALSLGQQQSLRRFLDRLWLRIVGKPFNSRKLLQLR
ncbi:DNA repair protein RecO [Leucothrix mucor]|uniref:DNA repair protein RecO n=1 Tax=Leucothrix mucor TaxID=45248 RepID=UPI0003B40364|nr:DNA repair protein RecO [Leucothrix mucor]